MNTLGIQENQKSIQKIQCSQGCCYMLVKNNPEITRKTEQEWSQIQQRTRSGVFIYDQHTQSVLIVQSNGWKWGVPKGSREKFDKSLRECAIREVYEETGLRLASHTLKKARKIDDGIYFKTNHAKFEINEGNISVSTVDGHKNDSTGIGWVKLECLADLSLRRELELTYHFKILLRDLHDINLFDKSRRRLLPINKD